MRISYSKNTDSLMLARAARIWAIFAWICRIAERVRAWLLASCCLAYLWYLELNLVSSCWRRESEMLKWSLSSNCEQRLWMMALWCTRILANADNYLISLLLVGTCWLSLPSDLSLMPVDSLASHFIFLLSRCSATSSPCFSDLSNAAFACGVMGLRVISVRSKRYSAICSSFEWSMRTD